VFVHHYPALRTLLQNHGPARIEMRTGAFFADEFDGKGEGCPSKRPAAVHGEVIIDLCADAVIGLE
jgi:hypothetical protein